MTDDLMLKLRVIKVLSKGRAWSELEKENMASADHTLSSAIGQRQEASILGRVLQ